MATTDLLTDEDIWGELDAALDELVPVPQFAPDEAPKRERYTILAAGDEKAQGRRAAHHLARIRQIEQIADTRRGGLEAHIEGLESELTRAKLALGTMGAWVGARSAIDNGLIAEWLASAPQFLVPDTPRDKSIDLGVGVVGIATNTVPESITLPEDDAAARAFFGEKFLKPQAPKFLWGEAKKTLVLRGAQAVVEGSGEVVPDGAVVVRPKTSEKTFYVVVDGKRHDLTGATVDGNGDDGDGTEFDDTADDDGNDSSSGEEVA